MRTPADAPRFAALALLGALVACNGGGGGDGDNPAPPPPEPATPQLTALHTGLQSPWGLALLPDGQMLVTQKAGSLLRLSADGRTTLASIAGVPAVASAGQGGLLDVAIDPDYSAAQAWIYLSYAEPGSGAEAGLAGTAVLRARLSGDALVDSTVIFRQAPKVAGGNHFGSRLVFARDKTLFVTLGERFLFDPAQDVTQTLGKVVRIARDGTVPADNPTFGAQAGPGLWSIGNRNPQGSALNPDTG